ncbi:MAG: hypothetical protein QOJ63_3135 [Solirubrobacteraceae bacterium]|jgi:hypothetical protein|nr:hypothetical protein [Solirubrobacteraceae bacterium]
MAGDDINTYHGARAGLLRLMLQPMTRDDDTILDELRRVFAAIDPIPDPVRRAARAAIEWRTTGAELAGLVHDSIVDGPATAGRDGTGSRVLTFEAPDLTIALEAQADADETLRLVGRLDPPQPAQIVVRHGSELIATRADERGRFVAAVARGPLSVRVRLGDEPGAARLVETAWLTI